MFHRCVRWRRNGFLDCPYVSLTEHEDTEEDDDEEDDDDDTLDKFGVPGKRPAPPPPPVLTEGAEQKKQEEEKTQQEDNSEIEVPWVPPGKRGTGLNENVTVAGAVVAAVVQQQMQDALEKALEAVPVDNFGLWKQPAVITPLLAPLLLNPALVTAPALAPVLEGAYKGANVKSPAGVIETAIATALGAAAGQAAGKALQQPLIPAVVAVALQEVSQAATITQPEDYFGAKGIVPVTYPAAATVPTLSSWEMIMLGAAMTTVAAVAVGGAGYFFNWANELEQLMGTR